MAKIFYDILMPAGTKKISSWAFPAVAFYPVPIQTLRLVGVVFLKPVNGAFIANLRTNKIRDNGYLEIFDRKRCVCL